MIAEAQNNCIEIVCVYILSSACISITTKYRVTKPYQMCITQISSLSEAIYHRKV
jgi:hypothetical protein